MKDINALVMPDDVRYADDHEWARVEGDLVRIGLDDYAQDQLGDIVFVGLPEVGATFSKGDEFATVDSVKASAECYMPVSGEIVEVNEALEESPQSVNQSPYKDGWFVLVKPDDLSELDSLMTSNSCLDKLRGKE
ncbi:MAG: glycine cleavage system protein GcvH [bacterium]